MLGLGCENNNIEELKKVLGEYDSERIKFLNVQDCEDEIAQGVKIIKDLQKQAEKDTRKKVPASMLKIGLKCGGSDGLSGITANPLVGKWQINSQIWGLLRCLPKCPKCSAQSKY